MSGTIINPPNIYLNYYDRTTYSPTTLYLGSSLGFAALNKLSSGASATLQNAVSDLETFLNTPLNTKFDSLFNSMSSVITANVSAGIVAQYPTAYNIVVDIPSSGALTGSVLPTLAPGANFPAGTAGTTLLLYYAISGMEVRFSLRNNGPFPSSSMPA